MYGFTLLEAALIAAYYWFAWWGGANILFGITWNATFNGMIIGLLLGDIKTGIIMGGTIQTIYLAHIGGGGNLLSDQALASCVAIPIAMRAGMDPEAALALAVTFGLLGNFCDSLQRTLNGFVHRRLEKDVDRLTNTNLRSLYVDGIGGSIIMAFICRFPLVFGIIYLGGNSIGNLMEILPAFITGGLSTVGKMLPGIGMLMVARLIGQKMLLPFFVIGFLLMRLVSPTVFSVAVIGLCLGILWVILCNGGKAPEINMDMFKKEESTKQKQSIFTRAERAYYAFRLTIYYRMGISFEYLNGVGIMLSQLPWLAKIYKDDLEGMKAALNRSLEPYVSDVIIGGSIIGAVMSMEENIADGEQIDGSMITTIKSSLMGPMAGFGDSIIQTTISPIIRSLFLPFALSGSIIGAMMDVVGRIVQWAIAIVCYDAGYTMGKNAMMKILRGGWIQTLMTCVSVLGMTVLGALASNYTKLALAVEFDVQGSVLNLDTILNGVMPGFVSATYLVVCYLCLEKGVKYIHLILGSMALAFVGCFLGIF